MNKFVSYVPRFRISRKNEGWTVREPGVNNQPHSYALLAVRNNNLSRVFLDGTTVRFLRRNVAVNPRPAQVWAMSAALTYYHPPREPDGPDGNFRDGWVEPPSLFNPFWRSKLQQLTVGHAEDVLRPIREERTEVEEAYQVLNLFVPDTPDMRFDHPTGGRHAIVR